MNPSIEDIANAVSHVNADSVIILPNNSNIIMAAENAVQLIENKKCYVVPTKEVPIGIKDMVEYAKTLFPLVTSAG